MTTERLLAEFLASIEVRAFTMARTSTRNQDDAMDIVQDSMIKLVTKYSDKPPEQWTSLFYRILQNKITDWHRKQKFLGFFFKTKSTPLMSEQELDHDIEDLAIETRDSEGLLQLEQASDEMCRLVASLPLRQQQCFMLRCWEGIGVKETADIMQCSEGSVKTHYSRALARLQEGLKGYHYD